MFAALPIVPLRAFESAARHRSFKAAAAELSVTPAAVSHQVRSLEACLGVALFTRLPRGVALTSEGERLFGRLHGALLDMAQAVEDLRRGPAEGALTVTTTASFAALWLVPRLGRFYRAHPSIRIAIDTNGAPVDLHQQGRIDVAIRYGESQWPSLVTACRLAERFAVYGTPEQVRAARRATPELITVQWKGSTLYQRGWAAWCAAAGERWLEQGATVRAYEEESYALQAAIAGQGLVLASSVMVSDALSHGLLVPYREDISHGGAAYAALCVPGRERHPPVRAFLGWLASEWQ